MKEKQDYIRDIAEMRSLMERSSRFLSLSGLAGVMAGIYALIGAYIAYKLFYFNPDQIVYDAAPQGSTSVSMTRVIYLALAILVLTIGTAIFLSSRNASKRGEKLWNPTAKRLLVHMSVPLVAGGFLILVLISKGLIGLVAPLTLVFYGIAIYNAGKVSYEELRSLGLIEIALGLTSSYFIGYGLLFWAIGFGLMHIVYGIYMHYRYER